MNIGKMSTTTSTSSTQQYGVVDGVVNIVDDKINSLTDRLEQILKDLKVDSEKFSVASFG